MQVILKKDIPNVGRMGELVKVRTGYARNFLIPRSMAVAANPGNVEVLEHHKRLIEFNKKAVRKESEALVDKLKKVKISLTRKFNEAGKLFGSLTNAELAAELLKSGFTVDRRDIEFDGVKAAGDYTIRVRLPGDVFCEVALTVKAEAEKVNAAAKSAAKKPRAKKAKATAEGEESETAPTADETAAEE
jgi:large subunit ribosomal protein L9